MTTAFLNTKIGEDESKIPDIIGLVKKIDYSSKISDIEVKYFTTSDDNKFASEILDKKLKQTNSATNSDLNAVSQHANKCKEQIEKLKTLN